MKLSIIIPCYNAGETIGEQLAALAGQVFDGEWEVIVVDNGSDDRSIVIAESFRDRLPLLNVISAHQRRGSAYARNRGVAVARSKYLVFLDADDVVGPNYLTAMFEALERYDFVACRYEYTKLNRTWISRCSKSDVMTGLSCGLIGPYTYAGGGSLGIRRRVHDIVGGFDEVNFPVLQDADYCIRLQRAGISLHFAPAAIVHYRWRDTVIGAIRQARNWGRQSIVLRARHWSADEPLETPRSLLSHLLRLRRIRTGKRLANWVWAAGWKLGAIEGWRRQRKNPIAYLPMADIKLVAPSRDSAPPTVGSRSSVPG